MTRVLGPLGAAPAVPVTATAPLSFGQLAVWRLYQAMPIDQRPGYNLVITWPLPPCGDAETLAHALHTLVGRHESLRTWFDDSSGYPKQVVQATAAVDLRVRVGTADDTAQYAEAGTVAAELASTPYQLDAGPGWRAAALTDPAGRPRYMALSVHHIVADGWALGRLRSELLENLAAGGEPLPPRKPAPQPRELALEQHSAAWHPLRQATRRYWSRLFDEIPGYAGTDSHDDAGRIEARLSSVDSRLTLSAAAHRTGLSPATIMLALSAIFVRAVRPAEPTLTLVSNNRFVARWQPLVTSMSQNMPFPARMDSPDEDLTAFAQRLYGAAIEGYRYSCYDVDELAEFSTQRLGGRLIHENYFNYSSQVTAEEPAGWRGPARADTARPRIENMTARRATGPRVYIKVYDESDDLVVDIRTDPRLVDEPRLHRALRWYHDEFCRLAAGEVSRLGDMIERCRT
jgi:hypothetical protein